MSLLSAHFEQIAISCQGIDSLPFPPPRIFTNALLSNPDITSLIRDTESHERALFSVPPPPPPVTTQPHENPKPSSRRQTVFNVASGEVTTSASTSRAGAAPRRNTAVAAVLGGDLHEQIRRSERRGGKDAVDVEMLLKGAEKLCGVYPLPGALDRIAAQRTKYAHSQNTLAYYEAKVDEQAEALRQMHKDHWMDEDEDEEMEGSGGGGSDEIVTEEELKMTEAEVRELEKKKRELQERLRGMDKDLGALLNM
ncbi:DASH complex subunit Spc34 [Xylaria bambusicola]|uniref:DASH complex subunit Spc34 n=1 Tax=Xylaria bambusicola TaxID=326684 RepID=UPI002008962C|nr:DASH complex subunit Spc34 [Xylaria bambusicola]KAI0516971.1 DASH complex subunit Spc34 [Xylaria bambusicola]